MGLETPKNESKALQACVIRFLSCRLFASLSFVLHKFASSPPNYSHFYTYIALSPSLPPTKRLLFPLRLLPLSFLPFVSPLSVSLLLHYLP